MMRLSDEELSVHIKEYQLWHAHISKTTNQMQMTDDQLGGGMIKNSAKSTFMLCSHEGEA